MLALNGTLLWIAMAGLCTLITGLTGGGNRPLIPAPAVKRGWPSETTLSDDYWY